MTPLTFYLDKVAFAAPGAESWEALTGLLHDDADWSPAAEWDTTPECLSSRAARRVTPQIRLALRIAEQLASSLDESAGWIFASSLGEGETLQNILESLRTPEMMIQPLRFQNAVHNAAAGQWSIAAGLTGPTTSIAALEQTAGAGLLKAGVQLTVENRSVGLVFYDVPLPAPLNDKFPLGVSLGAGFAFTPDQRPSTRASIGMSICDATETQPAMAVSRAIQATGNPVAAVMPLLEALCSRKPQQVVLGLHGGSGLCLDVVPQ